MERFIFCTDYHGDRSVAEVEKNLFEFIDEFKPHHRIFGGDLIDLRPLRKGASQEEKAEGIKADVDQGLRFLKKYKPNIFLMGNHDDRLRETAAGTGTAAEYAQHGYDDLLGKCQSVGANVIEYDKRQFYQYGTHKFIHGFSSGIYAVRKHTQHYGPCVIGHIHSFQVNPCEIAGIGSPISWSSGCLGMVDMDYNKRHLGAIRQEAGWLYGIKTKSGKLEIFPCRQETEFYSPYGLDGKTM